jgi:hypothetical protein
MRGPAGNFAALERLAAVEQFGLPALLMHGSGAAEPA